MRARAAARAGVGSVGAGNDAEPVEGAGAGEGAGTGEGAATGEGAGAGAGEEEGAGAGSPNMVAELTLVLAVREGLEAGMGAGAKRGVVSWTGVGPDETVVMTVVRADRPRVVETSSIWVKMEPGTEERARSLTVAAAADSRSSALESGAELTSVGGLTRSAADEGGEDGVWAGDGDRA